MQRVLFVCMGNICRSPTAEGVFRKLVADAGLAGHFQIDSAGTHAYHIGDPPDLRAQQHARQRGYDLSTQQARHVAADDFARFGIILAMDRDNLAALSQRCPPDLHHKLRLMMQYAPGFGTDEVPDPYYGGDTGFAQVLDYLEAACSALLEDLKRQAG